MDNMTALNAWELEADAKSVLARVGIQNPGMKIEAMSGGQARKVAVAAALLGSPDVLILDEPTNHMDVQARPPQPSTRPVISDFTRSCCTQIARIADTGTAACILSIGVIHRCPRLPRWEWPQCIDVAREDCGCGCCMARFGTARSRAERVAGAAVQFIEWMVETINTSGVTLLLVTHDRAFLEDTCLSILELDEGRGFVHRVGGHGGYERYRQRRAERRKAQAEVAQDAKVRAHLQPHSRAPSQGYFGMATSVLVRRAPHLAL